MVIKGYTDNAGSDTYNKKLSAFRANIVKSYLVGKGVDAKRIDVFGMGPNSHEEGAALEKDRKHKIPEFKRS